MAVIKKETQEKVLKDIIAHYENVRAAKALLAKALENKEAMWQENVLALDECEFRETVFVRVDDKTYKIDFDYEEFNSPSVVEEGDYTQYFQLATGD